MSLGSGYLVERKKTNGELVDWDASTIGPRTQASEEGYLKVEAQVAREVSEFFVTKKLSG